jgi:hypothetical protein
MRRVLSWYGANPLHLLALLGCFALAGYASIRLVQSHPLAVAIWFVGAVVGHDLLLVPLYSLADRSAMAVIRHRAPRLPAIPWINYLRVPTALSALLLLIWLPLILRLHTNYQASTTLSPNPYLWHWLAVTGALFLLSATAFALRLRGRPRAAAAPPGGGAAAPPAAVGHSTENAPNPGGSPAPGALSGTPQPPGAAREDQHEPVGFRPVRPPSGAAQGGSAETVPGPGPHEPAIQAPAAATPADPTDQDAGPDSAKDGQADEPPHHP